MYEAEVHAGGSRATSLPRLFSGSVADARCVIGTQPQGIPCILDLPLSFVVDVLVSPYTLVQQVRHGNFHPRFVQEIHDQRMRDVDEGFERFHKDAPEDGSDSYMPPPPDPER
ncbi:MAG TPA: hypothetical protein VFL36_24355 [Myxococcales bacterium]|nr:hypothetical protein [Myxococcales bacterium]